MLQSTEKERKIMKNNGTHAIHKPGYRQFIAIFVVFAMIASLMPMQSAWAEGPGDPEYDYKVVLTAEQAAAAVPPIVKKTQEDYLKLLKAAGSVKAYIPYIDAYVPYLFVDKDTYVKDGEPSLYVKKADFATSDEMEQKKYTDLAPNTTVYVHVNDPTIPAYSTPTLKQTKNGVAIVDPISIEVIDSDPTSNFVLDTKVHYNPAYGEDLFESIENMKKEMDNPKLSDKDKVLIDAYFATFFAGYPIISSNMGSISIDGALDDALLNNIPGLLSFLKTEDAKNLTGLSLTSTVPVPQATLDYWKVPGNVDARAEAALKAMDINLKLQSDVGTDKEFADIIASYGPNSLKVNDVVIIEDQKAIDDKAAEEAAKAAEEAAKLDPESPTYYLPGGGGYDAVLKVASVGTAVKTIYVQAGKTVKIPYVAYANKGFKNKTVSLAWLSSNPKVANVSVSKKTGTITKNKKAGTIKTGKLDGKSVLTVKATKKVGTSKITLKANDKKKVVYVIKVVKKAKKVSAFKLGKVATLKKGKTKAIKISKITKSATSGVATFTIAKKYQKYLTVDAAGKLVAKKAYQKGKKAIPVQVKVGKKAKTLKVKVK
jgi:hypothetical protein